MKKSKLILLVFVLGFLAFGLVSCEKTEYVQPDRNVVTQQTTGSDRDVNTNTGTGMCNGNDDGREDSGGCNGGG